MRKLALCFLLFCFSFELHAAEGLREESDSTAGAIQRVILSESIPKEKARINRFKFYKEQLEGDCLCEDYTVVETDSLVARSDIDDFINILLYQYGVFPDLIEASYVSDTEYLKQRFNEKPVYKAEVLYKGEPLPMVSWKEFPNLKTSGVFTTSDATLSPQRRGFMFSPDIYNFTDKNTKSSGPKLFRAIKYDLTERLRYNMPLRGEESNMGGVAADHITTTNLDFVDDPKRGAVAYFNGRSSYIDIRSDFEEELQEISVAAWINPEDVEGSLSLVGKGEVFSAKIFNGKLRFTAIGIKDHTTTNRVVEKGVWSHIAMVYVPEQKLYFYLNGELIEEVPASGLQHANHALLVGSNLWGQNYSGLMSDLNIWKRALSDEQIREVYLNPVEISRSDFSLLGWFGVLASGSLLLVWLFFFRKKKQPIASSKIRAAALVPVRPNSPYRRRINLLNGFRVWNKKGEDCTHRFSPKRKELMVLIIIYTLKDGGITSKELSDILWPGFSTQNKKNNRSTQVKEIRNILRSEMGAEIVFKDKKWQFELNDGVQVDLFELDKLLPKLFATDRLVSTSVERAVALAQIVSNGPLLPLIEEEWLDIIKANYNSKVLNMLTPYLEDNKRICASDSQEIIEAILVVDPLYDSAIRKKVEHLMSDGKYGSAKKVVENYKKLYHSYYNEPSPTRFLESVEM